jgi:hypothetical protein
VRGELLPQLEDAGLRLIVDYRDFEIGVPRLVNIERAVDRSRHTLIVLTPDWVEGEWEEFQSLLAATNDPAGRRRKLIPLMYRRCTPPSRIAMLDYADLTQPDEREDQMRRLVRGLSSQSAEKPPKRGASAGATKPPAEQMREHTSSPPDRQALPINVPEVSAAGAEDQTIDFVIVTALEEEREAMLTKLPGYRKLAPSDADVHVYYSAHVPATFSDGSTGAYRVVVLSLLLHYTL